MSGCMGRMLIEQAASAKESALTEMNRPARATVRSYA